MTLESLYHDKINPTVEEINLIQSSVYPIFAIFIISALVGLIFLGKKFKKEDMSQMLVRLSRIPEYLNRIRSSPIFTPNQAQPSAPFFHNPDFTPQRQNPYYNNSIPIPSMTNNSIMTGTAPQNGTSMDAIVHGNG